MRCIFISDLHLSADKLHQNQTFCELIYKWQEEVDCIYILGDFFDAWCGDDDDNEFIRIIKTALSHFTRFKPIYFIRGNHDFAIGKQFAHDTGITLLNDCTLLEADGHKILLSHGDRFCTLDVHYQKLKKFSTNPIVLWILCKLPLSWRYKIKAHLEHKSNKNFNKYPPETYQVVTTEIIKEATKYDANIVIHGHTHTPNLYPIKTPDGKNILRFEIPDWFKREPGGYVMLDNGQIKIHWA